MIQTQVGNRDKTLQFLRKFAPFSVIDAGETLATTGNVSECSQTGGKVTGIVKDTDENSHTAELQILSGRDMEARCTCCGIQEMSEQWCPHAVALFWRASELGFFDPHGGFEAGESTYRMNTSSPQEIASVISELSSTDRTGTHTALYTPKVRIVLNLGSDRLGVQVLFDGDVQIPALFEGFKKTSSRALDNILLQLLDDEGSWDDESQNWFVNSSSGVEVVLGIVEEYRDVISAETRTAVAFSDRLLDAKLHLHWRESSLELTMDWVLPDGSIHPKTSELIGTGPFWTALENTIYRVSPTAARIAAIFPYSSSMTLPRSQVGPILEVLSSGDINPILVDVLNPELQPESEVKTPVPIIELDRKETFSDHFSSQQDVEISATVNFEYPTPPPDRNVVFLPDRQKERECLESLKSLGFESSSDRRRHTLTGDAALDLLQGGRKLLPQEWEVRGFEALRKGVRFANLNISMALTSASSSEGERSSSRPDWFDCHITLTRNNANIPLSTIFKSVRSDSDRWLQLDGGSYARVPGGNIGHLKTTLGMLDPNFKLSNTLKCKLSTAQAISLSRIDDESFSVSLDTALTALSKKLKDFKAIGTVQIPKTFQGKLRHYQIEGVSWLKFLHDFELGGILADEMGLGKTVQTLALFQFLKESKSKANKLTKPALVVAPTSVITNWMYEARRFTPKLKIALFHGPNRKDLLPTLQDQDIVITSYALLRLDRNDLERYEFSFCILDEAQNIKNPQAATTKAAKSLKARYRLALTGTPTENRPLELWSIMDFLMPGYLGSSEFFRTYIEKPILEGSAQVPVAKLLNQKTRPFILRRTKAEVEKDLPPKVESVLHVEMTPSQAVLYNQILEEVRPRVFDAVAKKGVRGASVSILAALLRLRQVCNHPNSIEALRDSPGYESGKFELLKELLEEALEGKRKILLFSQFRDMLAIMRRWLDSRGENYLYLDGATTNRQDLIDKFNSDDNVRLFLISLKAGGTGLNLATADTVIIYDPWWNPAVESQAVDRAHRIGQTKRVTVYRLVTENSVEQKIMDLKAKKAKIVDALINENGLSAVNLSKADLELLFSPFPTT